MNKLNSVLIIDDDKDDCQLFTDSIREFDANINCLVAHDGQLALDLLNTMPGSLPSLIFLDLRMPRLSGKKCLIEIKKNAKLKSLPVVMYSTTSDTNEIREYYKLGAHDFLIKPNNFPSLCDSLESIFNLTKSRRSI